ISDRRHLELQLRQSQKMEAIGRLAGGVAHDFNNLLMVIKGHTELLLNVLPPSDHIARKIEQIDHSADRAAALTRQLLAFSRMQVLQPQVINVNSIVEEIGKLVIETRNADLDQTYTASHPLMKPGAYIQLTVSDSGCGMDAETQSHIFEPFFTTKEKGKGTGLGLATVYGIVKQSGGFIWVYSELGKGTSFKIYIPRVDQAEEHSRATAPTAEVPTGTETVLLTEDEQDVREIARE